MTHRCCDCRLVTDKLADGRYCPGCRSGVLTEIPSDQADAESPSSEAGVL